LFWSWVETLLVPILSACWLEYLIARLWPALVPAVFLGGGGGRTGGVPGLVLGGGLFPPRGREIPCPVRKQAKHL